MLDLQSERGTHIDDRLRAEEIIWLSTVRPDGRPHLVPVWYLWTDETILIFSQPGVQKVRNIAHNPEVVLALNAVDEGEDVVIIEGEADLLPNGTVDATLPAYAEKYAKLMTRIESSPEMMASSYTQAIRVKPQRFLPA